MNHDLTPRVRRARRALLAGAATLLSLGTLLTVPSPAAAFRPTMKNSDACGTLIPKGDGTVWSCTFNDDFSGTALDTKKWYVSTTAATGFYAGQTCFTSDNVAVSNGELRLTARDTGSTFTCQNPYGAFQTRYTGAHIGTVGGRFQQTYGRFDVRAKYPATGPGLHSGSWLMPATNVYGAWPASGEIDATEWWSSYPKLVLPTLHYNGSTWDDTGWNCSVLDPTQWHTYSLVWLPTAMTFSIDGQACFTRSWTPTAPQVAPQPFDQPFNLLLSMFVDNSGTNTVDATTTFPATYTVDYVKAWK